MVWVSLCLTRVDLELKLLPHSGSSQLNLRCALSVLLKRDPTNSFWCEGLITLSFLCWGSTWVLLMCSRRLSLRVKILLQIWKRANIERSILILTKRRIVIFTVHGNSETGVPPQPLCRMCLIKWNLRLNRVEQVLHSKGLLTKNKQTFKKKIKIKMDGVDLPLWEAMCSINFLSLCNRSGQSVHECVGCDRLFRGLTSFGVTTVKALGWK